MIDEYTIQNIVFALRQNGLTKRNDVIKVLKNNKLTSTEANQIMNAYGLGNLTTAERSGFPKTYKGQVGEAAVRNLKEFAASFPTLIGAGIIGAGRLAQQLGTYSGSTSPLGIDLPTRSEQSAIANIQRRQQEHPEDLANVAKGVVRAGNTPKNIRWLFDTILSPYNISSARIGSTFGYGSGPALSLDDIVYGAADNPVFAGLDITTLGSMAKIPQAASKAIKSVPGVKEVSKRMTALRKFNDRLNTAKTEAERDMLRQDDVLRRFNREWQALPQEGRLAVSRALQQTGETRLANKDWNTALKLARISSKRSSKNMANLGIITPEQNANNIIANYIGNNIGWKNSEVPNPEALQDFLKTIQASDEDIKKRLPSNKPYHTVETLDDLGRDTDIVAAAFGINPRAVQLHKNKKWINNQKKGGRSLDPGIVDLEGRAITTEHINNIPNGLYNYTDEVMAALKRLQENNYRIKPYEDYQYSMIKFNKGIAKGINKYAKNPTAKNAEDLVEYIKKNSFRYDDGQWAMSAEEMAQDEIAKVVEKLAKIDELKAAKTPIGDVNHEQILSWIENPKTMPSGIKPIYEQGKKLQSQGRLAFITQAVNPSQGIAGSPVPKAASYAEQLRYIGTRTPEDMAEYIPQALEFQARQSATAKGMKHLFKRLGLYEPEQQFTSGKVDYYSIKDMDKYLNKQYAMQRDPSTIIMGLPKATEEEIKAGKAIPIYPREKRMLARYGAGGSTGSEWVNRFKRAVLGRTKWWLENRIQSRLNNLIEGVGIKNYTNAKEAMATGRYPKAIDALTRAYGYAQDIPGSVGGGFAEAANRMWLGLKGVVTHALEGEPREAARSLAELPAGLADFVSQPMFRLEGYSDKLERLANYDKQLEVAAKKFGTTKEKVAEAAEKNPAVFEAVYGEVNRSLGDYTSRYYWLPKGVQQTMEAFSPFWKFPKNTITTTAHQLLDKPVASQLLTVTPAKIGKDVWEREVKDLDVNMEGGYPTGRAHPATGKPTMITSESHPLTAVIHQLGSLSDIGAKGPEELTQGVSPIFGLSETMKLRNSFGQPATTKDWTVSRDPLTGQEFVFRRDNEGNSIYDERKLSPLQYANWLGSQALQTFYSPVVSGRTDVRRVYKGLVEPMFRAAKENTPLSQALQEATMYPLYPDQFSPLAEGNTSGTPTVGALSILAPMVGIREVTPYQASAKAVQNAFKAAARKLSRQRTPQLQGQVEYNVYK